jgi:hypothetical protein
LDPRDLRDPETATAVLASLLSDGELALLLGAGVSKDMGLPGWGSLVLSCEDEAGLSVGPADGQPAAVLMQRMAAVQAQMGDEFLPAVRRGLYTPEQLRDNAYGDTALTNLLLIAIGAMVMPSSRGSVAEVLTLNFDDLLEWYLDLHGFAVQVVSEVPDLMRATSDARIYHIHGFLPLRSSRYEATSEILLTDESLEDRLADHSKAWPRTIASLAMSKVLLFVGTTAQDVDVLVTVRQIRDLLRAPRPMAFNVTVGLDEDAADRQIARGIVPVVLRSHTDIPHFLLSVCRTAAGT